MRHRFRTLVKLIVATYVLFVVILRFLPTGGRALRPGADCAGSIRAVRQERSNPGCIMCSSLMDDARRQTRRSCSLPYDELVRLIEFEGGDAVAISSGGGTRMLVSSRRDSRSCGGLELLREILHEHASAAMPDEHAECELQRQLQRVASELGRSLSPPMGAAGETVPSSGAFTLLQDCTEPPCCPHEMRTLAAENPHAALFVAQDGGRTADAAAANVAESPLNLWSVESVRDIESLEKRRRAARGCGGSCFTLQIAHALQAHPLHSSPIAAPRTLKGATGGSPQRRLQWMSRQELAEAQEAEAAARQGAHSGLLKAARRAAGGMLLTEALKLQLMPRTVCRLRTALAAAPLLTDSRPQTRLWKITGAQLIAASSASRDSSSAGASSRASSSLASTNASAPSRLDTLMPAAADVIEALEAAAAELQRRGLCANPEHPIVVDGPTGTARRVAACAVRSAPRSGAAAATSSSRCASPLVQCADGTCQPTFLHCYRALTSTAHPSSFGMAAELPDLLAHVLPACASPQRRRRLEEALPEAANLLSALASFDAATRELFPQLCPASMLL